MKKQFVSIHERANNLNKARLAVREYIRLIEMTTTGVSDDLWFMFRQSINKALEIQEEMRRNYEIARLFGKDIEHQLWNHVAINHKTKIVWIGEPYQNHQEIREFLNEGYFSSNKMVLDGSFTTNTGETVYYRYQSGRYTLEPLMNRLFLTLDPDLTPAKIRQLVAFDGKRWYEKLWIRINQFIRK